MMGSDADVTSKKATESRGFSHWRPEDQSAAAMAFLASPLRPAASRSSYALSVYSQGNSGSSRPKWPYAAVLA